jgi:hypothetical protein
MTPASAKLWISQQARQTRLSTQQVEKQVAAVENAQRQRLFTQPGRPQIALSA